MRSERGADERELRVPLPVLRFAIVALAACGAPHPAAPAADEMHWPPIVDSHVHLTLDPVGDQLAAHGVLAAIDLAAPERALAEAAPITLLRAGPMLTHPGGYPLDAWGSDGYGVGCADAACVRATVDRLAHEGARVIKVALDDDGLDPALLPAAVEAAHAHHLKIAVHALSDASSAVAAAAGVDVLAHTPVEPLADATVAAWHGRAVTASRGGSDAAVANLRKLRAAGVTVLYGTDLGNLRAEGPSGDELALLRAAGLDDAAITAAMTTTPIAYWGLKFDPKTTYLVLDGDPRRDVRALLHARVIRQP